MTAVDHEPWFPRNEALEVEEWRFCELLRMGVSGDTAGLAAASKTVDLRETERMIRAGCPPDLAIRIRL